MAKYHINAKGEPGLCGARKNCPFGDLESDHYSSPESARAAYEQFANEYFIDKNKTTQVDVNQGELFTLEDMNNHDLRLNSNGIEALGTFGMEDFQNISLEVVREADDDHEVVLSKLPAHYREAVLAEHEALGEALEEGYGFYNIGPEDVSPAAIKVLLQDARTNETQMAKVLLLSFAEGIEIEDWGLSSHSFELDGKKDSDGKYIFSYEPFSSSIPFFTSKDQQLERRYAETYGDESNYYKVSVRTV